MDEQATPTRSWLFTPATRPERFGKAGLSGADVLIIDLEDAVAPREKPDARQTAIEYLSTNKAGPKRALRINGLDTAAGLSDMAALLASEAEPDYIVLPKTESSGHLSILDRLLTAAAKPSRLIGLIESARGIAAVNEIARATPRLGGVMLGAADMAADLGIATAWPPLVFVRSRMVIACSLAGITPIDSPFFDVHDGDGLRRETSDAVAFGFLAKAAVHPHQVGPINEALTPTAEAIEHARAVLAANDKGVGLVDGAMIDEAVARKARRILAAAGA